MLDFYMNNILYIEDKIMLDSYIIWNVKDDKVNKNRFCKMNERSFEQEIISLEEVKRIMKNKNIFLTKGAMMKLKELKEI